jgi:hypothetical protein
MNPVDQIEQLSKLTEIAQSGSYDGATAKDQWLISSESEPCKVPNSISTFLKVIWEGSH